MRPSRQIASLILALGLSASANAKDAAIPAPPTPQQVLQDYRSRPLDFQQRLAYFCSEVAHAEEEPCLAYTDVASWGGRYSNEKVEIVPPEALPARSTGFRPVEAARAIPVWTKGHRVVLINEVHDNPETRLLPLELLAPLRKQGFDTLALESLDEGADVAKRGYPTYADGYYVREPIMGRLIREAIRLGYRVVGYDVNHPESMDIAAREQAQARRLSDMVRADNGHRVLVLAGLAHVFKQKGSYLKGEAPMAMRLGELLGESPFVIDQVYTFDGTAGQSLPRDGLYVLEKGDTPWSAKPKQFEVSIVARLDRSAPARTAWVRLAPSQRLMKVSTHPCGEDACLIEAYRKGDGTDAVPLDASVVDGKKAATELMLPRGAVEVRYTDTNGKLLATRDPER